MNLSRLSVAALIVVALSSGARATEYDASDEEHEHRDAVGYRLLLVPTEERLRALIERDLRYADEMMEHHRGALRMSESYLQDPRGTNAFLRRMARAIVANQQFEIGWLEDLRRRVAAGPDTVVGIGDFRLVALPAGIAGMEHRMRFNKTPISTGSNLIGSPAEQVTEYDVMFSKAMIMHHRMALDMARTYNTDENGGNFVIEEINFDILRDQAVEIGILESLIAKYDGDPDAVPIEHEMHGMMGMPHGS